jgi:ankyrin repeat protein
MPHSNRARHGMSDDEETSTKRKVKTLKPVAFNAAAKDRSDADIEAMRQKHIEIAKREKRSAEIMKLLKEGGRGAGGNDAIRRLVAEGIDPNAKDENRNSLLHYAAARGNLPVMAMLINAGADLHAENYDGATPLMAVCAAYNMEDAAVMLAAADPDPSTQMLEGVHVLHVAAAKGKTRLVEVLLQRGVSPVIEDPDGHTPLFHAIAAKEEAAEVLCMAGGCREQDLPQLEIAIQEKVMYGQEWDWNLLLTHAAKFDPAELQAAFPKIDPVMPPVPAPEVEKIFAEARQGSSSFRMEKYYSKKELVNSRDHDGRTPLMAGTSDLVGSDLWAVRGLAYDEDPKACDNAGRTALHYAAQHVSPADSIVDTLLGRGADVNAQDVFGRTALMVTVRGCNHIDKLMDWGANPFLTDLLGRTALDIAKIHKSGYAEERLFEGSEKHKWNTEELKSRTEKRSSFPYLPKLKGPTL